MKTNNFNIDFVGKRKLFFTFSAILIAAIVVFSVVFGVKADIQFTGGAVLKYSYTGELTEEEVGEVVGDILPNVGSIQFGEGIESDEKTLTIQLPSTETVSVEDTAALASAFTESFPENNMQQLELNNVSPTMGKSFLLKSMVAVAAAALFILIYIAIRFKNIGGWPAGAMAIVALLHDLVIVFGVYSFMRIPLSGNFIAVMLTILGYSINDTVVIYDRIRENKNLYGNKTPFDELVNMSLNQSFGRTINTTITTVLALAVVCVVSLMNNLDSVFTFVFPLMIGMISGVYSSICFAGPLWTVWEENKMKNKAGTKKTK